MQKTQRLHDRPHANLVVQRRRRHQPIAQVTDAELRRDRVAGAYDSFGVLTVPGPDVDPDILELRNLVAFFVRQQVRALARNYAGNGTALRPDGEALAEENLHVPAADRLNVEKAIVVHMLDHEADLIAMPRQHDARLALGIADRD